MSPSSAKSNGPGKLQFSLRTLLTAFVVIGIATGWFGGCLHRARQQQAAVNKLVHSGATVYYDFQFDSPSPLAMPDMRKKSSGPEWLRKVLGVDFFSSVRMVFFPAGADDQLLSHSEALRGLQSCHLPGAKVSGNGLCALSKVASGGYLTLCGSQISDQDVEQMPEMQVVNLSFTEVSDASIDHLAERKELKRLLIYSTRITEAGRGRLASLRPDIAIEWCGSPTEEHRRLCASILQQGGWINVKINDGKARFQLSLENELRFGLWIPYWKGNDVSLADLHEVKDVERLSLFGANITDRSLSEIAQLKDLEQLNLCDTPITDVGVKELHVLKSLTSLNVSNTKVTDASLVVFKQLNGLEALSLDNTLISDHALSTLQQMTQLKTLSVAGTRLSPQSIVTLEKSLVNTKVRH
ncbi:MAG: hypothetical protein K8T25_04040 [Planctomycetia bacterium]|nr:hypothetical protein [Planctomycetia bacterium]